MSGVTETTPFINRRQGEDPLPPVDNAGRNAQSNRSWGKTAIFGGFGIAGAAGIGLGIQQSTENPINPTTIATAVLGLLLLGCAWVGWGLSRNSSTSPNRAPESEQAPLRDVAVMSQYTEADFQPLQHDIDQLALELGLKELNGANSNALSPLNKAKNKLHVITGEIQTKLRTLNERGQTIESLEGRVSELTRAKEEISGRLTLARRELEEKQTDTKVSRLEAQKKELSEELRKEQAKNSALRLDYNKKADLAAQLQEKVEELEAELLRKPDRRRSEVSSVGNVSVDPDSSLNVSGVSPIRKKEDTDN